MVVAFSIGFDDAELTPYQLKVARLLASVAGGVGVIFSALRYIWERHQELAWQKTSFMVSLFKNFEQDDALRRAQELVDLSRWNDQRLREALRPLDDLYREAGSPARKWGRIVAGKDDPRQTLLDRLALDRYLDFFDHLYTYIFLTKTLEAADVTSFSGYAIDILDSESLSMFAMQSGYEDVLRLALHFVNLAVEEGREEKDRELALEVARRREVSVE